MGDSYLPADVLLDCGAVCGVVERRARRVSAAAALRWRDPHEATSR